MISIPAAPKNINYSFLSFIRLIKSAGSNTRLVNVAVSVFPDELYPAPRSWTERAFPKLIHYNRVAKGGHFAAWEQPAIFAAELRAGFKTLR